MAFISVVSGPCDMAKSR